MSKRVYQFIVPEYIYEMNRLVQSNQDLSLMSILNVVRHHSYKYIIKNSILNHPIKKWRKQFFLQHICTL